MGQYSFDHGGVTYSEEDIKRVKLESTDLIALEGQSRGQEENVSVPKQIDHSTNKRFKSAVINNNEADIYYVREAETVVSPNENYFEHQGDYRPILQDLEPKAPVVANIRIIAPLTEGERPQKMKDQGPQLKPAGDPFNTILLLGERSFAKFFLQGVREADKEKMQIIETFGEPYFNFFGREPRVYTFSGGLLNTKHNDWRVEFTRIYEESLRGTKLAEQNAKAYMTYQDTLVEGYPFHCVTTLSAQNPEIVPFSITMVVTNRTYLKGKVAPKLEELKEDPSKYKEVPDDIFQVVQEYIQFNKPMCVAKVR